MVESRWTSSELINRHVAVRNNRSLRIAVVECNLARDYFLSCLLSGLPRCDCIASCVLTGRIHVMTPGRRSTLTDSLTLVGGAAASSTRSRLVT